MEIAKIESIMKEAVDRVLAENPDAGAFIENFVVGYIAKIEQGLLPRPALRHSPFASVLSLIAYDSRSKQTLLATQSLKDELTEPVKAWSLYEQSLGFWKNFPTASKTKEGVLSLPYRFQKPTKYSQPLAHQQVENTTGYAWLHNCLVRAVPNLELDGWTDIYPVYALNGVLIQFDRPYIDEYELVVSITPGTVPPYVKRPTGRTTVNGNPKTWMNFPDMGFINSEMGAIVYPTGPNTNQGLASLVRN